MDSSKQPSNIGRNPVASPFASDDQFYGAGLWDFPFVRFKDMALSKILFRFRCANLCKRGPNHYQIIGLELLSTTVEGRIKRLALYLSDRLDNTRCVVALHTP